MEYLVIFILLFASACFASSEAALFTLASTSRSQKTESVRKLIDNREEVLVVILLINLSLNLSYFAATYSLTNGKSAGEQALINSVAILSIVLLGEIAPKVFAHRHPQLVTRVMSPLIYFFFFILSPWARWQVKNKKNISNDPAIQSADAVDILEEEKNVLDEAEESFMTRFLELGELRAGALRRPLDNLMSLEEGLPLGLAVRRMSVQKRAWAAVINSRYEVVGVLDRTRKMQGKIVKEAMFDVPILPEVAPVAAGLKLLKDNGGPFVLLVDEYGDSVGVIERGRWADTLLNRIPSRLNFSEELNDGSPLGSYLIKGSLALHEFADQFGEMPETDVRVDTVGGFVQEKLGRIPKVSEKLNIRSSEYSLKITVVEASDTKIETLRVEELE